MPDWRDTLQSLDEPKGSSGGDWRAKLGGAPVQPPAGQDDSWWSRHGRTVETAAAAGLALLAGPRLGRAAIAGLERAGSPGQAVLQAGRNVKATLAPSTVDEAAGRAAGLARQYSGEAARATATTTARLEPRWRNIGSATDQSKRDFISYVEGRSKGAKLKDPTLQPLADDLRDAYAQVHKDLGTLNQSQKIGFIEDYYRHQWVKDEASNRTFSKEGLGYFVKERKIPTIEEGLAKGLTPRTLDPVQTTLEYVSNARRFIATNKLLDTGHAQGDVFYKRLGYKGPFPTKDDRWVPLDGALAKRGGGQLYAKEGWARVYNNFVSHGFTGPAGELVHGLRRTSNIATAFELGLSGYHATTMANEAIINDVAKAISNIFGGKFDEAIKDLVKAPGAPYRTYKTGKKLESIYLGQSQGLQHEKKIADLLTKAGARARGMEHAKDYEYTSMGSFLQSWRRGALQAERMKYAADIKANPFYGVPKTVFSLLGRTIQTVSEPLFRYYIPRVKNGAFSDTMSQWLMAHPNASEPEQLVAARRIWDSIDNRFGELVQDNVFWKQHMKQVAMISMRSYSWNMGTIREIGGGLTDIASHKFTPRVAYVLALPIVYGTMSAIYQFLKTGQKPESSQDLLAPKTGGTDPKTGLPERMIMPGYMKDVFGWQEDPIKTIQNKESTFLSTGQSILTNRDWKGDPIVPPVQDPNAPFEETVPNWLRAYFGLVAQNITPISIRDIGGTRAPGSNITKTETFMGLKPAGRRFVDPEGYESSKRYREQKDWRKKLMYDVRQKAYQGIE